MSATHTMQEDSMHFDPEIVVLLSPFVVGLVEGAKKAGLATKYAGSAAMVYSFALTALVVDDPTSRGAAMTAIATGLTAAGLYSQARTIAEDVSARNSRKAA